MAYHIYQTEAFILDERALGESNKIYFLLTPDLGLVIARAQGVRLLKSKLRYNLARYSLIKVSLVRGKESWRLIGAEKEAGLEELEIDKDKMRAWARIAGLLDRFIHGEMDNRELFAGVKDGLLVLASLSDEQIENWEILMVFRILYFLGYVKSDQNTSELLDSRWPADRLDEVGERKTELTELINRAIKASQF